jgi:hypothetical protein
MTIIPQGTNMRATYENIAICCPSCGRENIYNRASDLKNVPQPVTYAVVSCSFADCAESFSLSGDSANPAYEMLILDCCELLERKHYSYCILNLAQAYEVFFSQYVRVELLYRPFAADFGKNEADIRKVNSLGRVLYETIRHFAFHPMRNLFFNLVLDKNRPSSLREAEGVICTLRSRSKKEIPSDEEIRNATVSSDGQVREILVRLKSCSAPDLRNDVVHKSAYRPTLNEVNCALKEAREVLFPLAHLLNIRIDDVNWYMRRRP